MAKKTSVAKVFIGLTALAVAGKVVFDKYKILKKKFEKEENESICDEVKKYNAVCTNKSIEVEDEVFTGCEIKAIASKLVMDLSLAVFEKDVYINFKSDASVVSIIIPEGINVTCDIENVASGIKNLVDNVDEEDIPTVFIIGKSTMSSIEIIPAGFYADDDFFEDDEDDFYDEEETKDEDIDVEVVYVKSDDKETDEVLKTEEIKDTKDTKVAEETEEIELEEV